MVCGGDSYKKSLDSDLMDVIREEGFEEGNLEVNRILGWDTPIFGCEEEDGWFDSVSRTLHLTRPGEIVEYEGAKIFIPHLQVFDENQSELTVRTIHTDSPEINPEKTQSYKQKIEELLKFAGFDQTKPNEFVRSPGLNYTASQLKQRLKTINQATRHSEVECKPIEEVAAVVSEYKQKWKEVVSGHPDFKCQIANPSFVKYGISEGIIGIYNQRFELKDNTLRPVIEIRTMDPDLFENSGKVVAQMEANCYVRKLATILDENNPGTIMSTGKSIDNFNVDPLDLVNSLSKFSDFYDEMQKEVDVTDKKRSYRTQWLTAFEGVVSFDSRSELKGFLGRVREVEKKIYNQ